MNAAIPYNDIIRSSDALNWGRNYGITGFSATILDWNTVIVFVTYKNMGEKDRMLSPLPPLTPLSIGSGGKSHEYRKIVAFDNISEAKNSGNNRLNITQDMRSVT